MYRQLKIKRISQIAFWLGMSLLILGAAFDLVNHFTNFWLLSKTSFALSVIGIITCLVVIPFRLIEWLKLPLGMRSKRNKFYHGLGNFIALLLLVGNFGWRIVYPDQLSEVTMVTFSTTSLVLAMAISWIGTRLAIRLSENRTLHLSATDDRIITAEVYESKAKDRKTIGRNEFVHAKRAAQTA